MTTATAVFRAVRAEWTKLGSLRSTAVALLSLVAVTVVLGLLSAQGARVGYGGPRTVDRFTFVHGPVTGDTVVTAKLAAQSDSAGWAKAGLMLKADATSGSPSVSLMLTPDHGVRMQVDAKTEITGGHAAAPYWLRLTRSGNQVTGSASPDGRTWRTVGTVTDDGLPATAQAGLFVASPEVAHPYWDGPGNVVGHADPTIGRAVFTQVAAPGAAGWQLTDVASTDPQAGPPGGPRTGPHAAKPAPPGTLRRGGGAFTVTGSGDIGSPGIGGFGGGVGADTVAQLLSGVQLALFAVVALGVLAVTSEYGTRTVRTTFTVSPRRGTVLAAKALVLAVSVFLAGLVAAVAAFLVGDPVQRDHGYAPPYFPRRSLTDPVVLRALVGTAAFLALVALLSLAVGVILRRTAGAIIALLAVLVVLPLVASITSVGADIWVNRATPIAGAAIRETEPLFEYSIAPWPGLAVLAGYTAAALAAAYWVQRRRDA